MSITNRTENSEPAIYVIHENEEWLIPLREAFENQKIPFVEWFVNDGCLSLDDIPPEGVFYNRMSASSHTRSHRYSVELTGPVIAWLEAHGRKVINGRRALQLEVRKFEQYISLQKFGIRVPETIAASGNEEILKAAQNLGQLPFILKPNRGGKGLGVELFRSVDELKRRLENHFEHSLDGISLIQEYIKPFDDTITRLEFIGGKFCYAVHVDTSEGFELCPADSCEIGDQFCPAPSSSPKHKFTIRENFEDKDLIARLERFFHENGIEIGAAEFVENQNGERFVYDININTNYNRQAELRAPEPKLAMNEVAAFLKHELDTMFAQAH